MAFGNTLDFRPSSCKEEAEEASDDPTEPEAGRMLWGGDGRAGTLRC